MNETPLYDATLSDLLLRARRESQRAQQDATQALARAAEVEQRARVTLARAERAALDAARTRTRAEGQATQVEQLVAARLADVRSKHAIEVAALQRRLAHAERLAAVRKALIEDEVEERVRASLALSARPLPPLPQDTDPAEPQQPTGHQPDADADADDEREGPPIPSMAELLKPSPGVERFLDALLGPS